MTHAPTHQFLWLAIETTHTDPAKGVILEVAAALAEDDRGGDLSIVHEWHAVTDEPWFDQAELDDAVVKMHTDSGLFEATATSPSTLATVEGLIVDALVQITGKPQPTGVVLAGLVASWTLPWVKAHMPRLASCLAFGVLDVGSLNKAAKAWHPEGFRAHYVKADRAQAKVHAALASATHWRQAVGL